MSDPDWAKILSYLYEEQEEIWYLDSIPDSSDIVEETGLPPEEIEEYLFDMHDLGLLEKSVQTQPDYSNNLEYVDPIAFSISSKGFDVAHDREMNANQQRTNIGIGILTVFLAIGSLLQGYSAFLSHDGLIDQLFLLIMIALLVIFGLHVVALMAGMQFRELLPFPTWN